MRKSLALKALFAVMLALVVASGLHAGEDYGYGGGHKFGSSFTTKEFGISILVSAGEERREIGATLVLTSEDGEILPPIDGVVGVPEGRKILAQIFMVGAEDASRYDIKWSTAPLVSKDNLRSSTFNPMFGWRFTLCPEDYLQSSDSGVRPLNIWVRAHGAKKDYVRAIFKITYKSGSLVENTQLLLKTVKCGPGGSMYAGTTANGNWDKVASNFAAQNQFNQQVTVQVNNLGQRVGNLESWAASASAPRVTAVTSGRVDYKFHVCVSGREYVGKIWLKLYSQKCPTGQSFACQAPWIPMNGALPGCYRVDYSCDGSNWKTLEYSVLQTTTVELAF